MTRTLLDEVEAALDDLNIDRFLSVLGPTGAFVNPEPTFLQSTGLVLDPNGQVLVSVYSNGPIGRLLPDDVIGMIRYVREQAAAGDPAGAPR